MVSRWAAILLISVLLAPASLYAATVTYELDIGFKTVEFAGTAEQALAISDQIPAPTLRAQVGDTLRVTFHNHLDVETSVHWHGILLPPDQDGVSYLNTRPIKAGASHTFEFPIIHSGTFWYHSHTGLQIQRGVYGSIVLSDSVEAPAIEEAVVVFSDWTNEDSDSVLQNLKKNDEYYAYAKRNVLSWDRVMSSGAQGFRNRVRSAFNRMGPMDLADVAYDSFLVNGRPSNELKPSNSSGQIMLRLINGSTSSYFDVEYAGGPMTIVAADGNPVENLAVQRLRIATAETYDVLVSLQEGRAFELRATSFDGSGFSSLFVGAGERVAAPAMPPPDFFLMSHGDMDMDMDMDMAMNMPDAEMAMPSDAMPMPEENHDHVHSPAELDTNTDSETSHDMSMQAQPVLPHLMNYQSLRALTNTDLPAERQWQEIELALTGSMERYVWSFNNKTGREESQILIQRGKNVRIHMRNETMMNHPIHLHGHFFRVVNGQGERSPLKHTVNVAPMENVTIEFAADEEQDWLFHCHNQYHMKAGMNRVISYEESSNLTQAIERQISPPQRWFWLNEFHLMSSFADYEISFADERHSFEMDMDSDLHDTYELQAFYNYHFNRFVSAFGGMQKRQHHHGDNHEIGVIGMNLTLPFMVESEWRLDDHGEFRVQLESELQLSRRFAFDWRWNTDNEYRYGLNYRLNNRFAITVHTDTEYGDGIGFSFYY